MGVCMVLSGTSARTLEEAMGDGGERRVASVDLDKAWHGIHFVLTGSTEDDGSALSGVILGGEGMEVEGEEVGIFLAPERVKETAAALAAVDEARFTELYASRKWSDAVYGPPDLDYFLGYFLEAADFYRQAAERNSGVFKIFY